MKLGYCVCLLHPPSHHLQIGSFMELDSLNSTSTVEQTQKVFANILTLLLDYCGLNISKSGNASCPLEFQRSWWGFPIYSLFKSTRRWRSGFSHHITAQFWIRKGDGLSLKFLNFKDGELTAKYRIVVRVTEEKGIYLRFPRSPFISILCQKPIRTRKEKTVV